MAKQSFERCVAITLRHEGGYADHPADPGGATNLGITRAVLAEWRGGPVTKLDVRNLTREEAGAIYRQRYWDAVGGDHLPPGVDLVVFDYAVNSGPGRAMRVLQKRLGVRIDGIVGPETLEAAREIDPVRLIGSISSERRGFLGRLRIFSVFGQGWLRRVASVETKAIQMAREAGNQPNRNRNSQEKKRMDLSKSFFASRTVWANIVGLAAIGASVLGFNTGGVDQGAVVDAILNGVAGASFVASTFFRVIATRKIG